MKPGSIVVVMPLGNDRIHPWIQWIPVDDENTPYMIREIEGNGKSAMLEEGVIGYNDLNEEISICIEYLREILPPEDITEEIEDILCVPVELNNINSFSTN